MTSERAAKGVAAPADIQAGVRRLVDDVGEAEAAARLEMSLQTLARVAAGFRVNRSTIGMARAMLAAAAQPVRELILERDEQGSSTEE